MPLSQRGYPWCLPNILEQHPKEEVTTVLLTTHIDLMWGLPSHCLLEISDVAYGDLLRGVVELISCIVCLLHIQRPQHSNYSPSKDHQADTCSCHGRSLTDILSLKLSGSKK